MWFGILLFSIVSFWLGQRYSDFRDLMMARRVAKLIEQRQRLAKEQADYERYVEADVKREERRAAAND